MPDYFHLTPEALTMRFYSKAQVKNSNLCDIADDNLPDNLFALKGEQLEIKEGTNTLNKDLALAIGFNQIFDQNTANQVGKLIVANGPLLDPKTILYYVKRLKNGPYGYGITQHIKANFDQAKTAGNSRVPFQQNLGGGSNIDNDFVSYLQNKLGAADCFLTPADYFDFQGVYGTLANTQNIWNYTTAPAFDTNNKETRGDEGYETANKMPKPLQMVNGVLNLATLGTYKKFLKLFKTDEELAKERANFKSGTSVRESNDGESATPDILTAKSKQEASTDGLSEIAEFLGDAFRVFTFQYRANPYGYTNSPVSPGNNAMIPQPPGTVGSPPITPRSIDNGYLNLPLGNIQENSSQTYNPLLPPIPPVTVVPYSKDPTISPKTSFRENSPTYQDFINGKSSYVGIITHPNIGYSEANVTISGFERNNTAIPLKIVGYSDDSDPERIKVLVEPNTQPFNSITGTISYDQSNNTAQTCAAKQPANVTSTGSIISPDSVNALSGPNDTALNLKAADSVTCTSSGGKCVRGTREIISKLTDNPYFTEGYESVVTKAGFKNPYSPQAKNYYWSTPVNDANQKLYTEIPGQLNSDFAFRNGDVLVYNAKNRAGAGHAEVYLNGTWYSDFKQNNNSLNSNRYSDNTLYRLNYLDNYK
jgi:hypothetical protein